MPLQLVEPWAEAQFMVEAVAVQVDLIQQFQPLSQVEQVAALTFTLRAVERV